MTFFAKIRAMIRRVDARIWLGLGVALLLVVAYTQVRAAGFRAGYASRDGEVAVLVSDLRQARANAAALEDAVARQNAAVAEIEAAGQAARRAAEEARRQADSERRSTEALRARLAAASRASGAAPEPADPLTIEAWEMLK
jgi:Skp family chaperone for outer membrane proteins